MPTKAQFEKEEVKFESMKSMTLYLPKMDVAEIGRKSSKPLTWT